jgi:nitrilase
MPQARYALYAQGEELHVGVFPGSAFPANIDVARFVAMEGRVYVLSVAGLLSSDDVPSDHPYYDLIADKPAGFFNGGSCIVAPDGSFVIEPVVDEERLVVADISRGAVALARQTFDASGHYARPDVFQVRVARHRLGVRFEE